MLIATIITGIVLVIFSYNEVNGDSRIYILKNDYMDDARSAFRYRPKRQSHPEATVAKLHDNEPFTPVIGPSSSSSSSSQSLPSLTFQNSDFNGLVDNNNGLIDYLVPPQLDAQIFNQNFQDPSLNLQQQNSVSFLDATVHQPQASNIQQFQSIFPVSTPSSAVVESSNNQNQIHLPQHVQTSSPSNHIQSITFQNSAPSLTAPTLSSVAAPSPTTQFPLSREAGTQFLRNEIGNQLVAAAAAANADQAKWELDYEAGEILSPPQQDLTRSQEYETIHLKRPNAAFNNPLLAAATLTTVDNFNTNNINNNNNFNVLQHGPSEGDIVVANQIRPNDQSNGIVWGSSSPLSAAPERLQTSNFIAATTSTPAAFLPTVSSNNRGNSGAFRQFEFSSQSSQQQSNNNPNLSSRLEQHPSLAPPAFNSYLSQQGTTVSDHTLFPFHDNVRQFQRRKRRQIVENEKEQEEGEEEEEQVKNTDEINDYDTDHRRTGSSNVGKGPVYSFVKTDKNGHYKWSVRHPTRRR